VKVAVRVRAQVGRVGTMTWFWGPLVRPHAHLPKSGPHRAVWSNHVLHGRPGGLKVGVYPQGAGQLPRAPSEVLLLDLGVANMTGNGVFGKGSKIGGRGGGRGVCVWQGWTAARVQCWWVQLLRDTTANAALLSQHTRAATGPNLTAFGMQGHRHTHAPWGTCWW
jgi:hypothetical protein